MAEFSVTEPTMLDDVPETVYHSGGVETPGPQISQSGLKLLRPPSTPREFQHYLLNGLTPTAAMDKGSAAHTIALGRGDAFSRHPDELLNAAGSWNSTKDSKAWISAEREAGRIPLRGTDYDEVFRMADEILEHPVAGELFTDPERKPEVSAFHEPVAGLWMRSRFDLLGGGLCDLKTAADPHPDAWRRHAWDLGYHIQDLSYRRAWAAVTGQPDPGPMTFVVVGSTPPHLVSVVQLDAQFEQFAADHTD